MKIISLTLGLALLLLLSNIYQAVGAENKSEPTNHHYFFDGENSTKSCVKSLNPNTELTYIFNQTLIELNSSRFSGEDDTWYYSGQMLKMERESSTIDASSWSILLKQSLTSKRQSACLECELLAKKYCFVRRYRFQLQTEGDCIQPRVDAIEDFKEVDCPEKD